MLDEKALKAIDKLEQLAAEELAKRTPKPGDFHDDEMQMLSNVPGWAMHVKTYHGNPYSQSTVESCLINLRKVARHFKFDLKEKEK